MGRKAYFSSEDIARATLNVIGDRGPGGVTVSAISKELECPVGSIYHRYRSLEQILAETWLSIVKSFQDGFLECLRKPDIHEAGRAGAVYTPQWSREHYHEARVLLRYRREDLISGQWPDAVKEEANRLGDDLTAGFRDYVARRFNKATPDEVALARFAVIFMPKGAVSPYLESGKPIESCIDEFVLKAFTALMEQ